MAEPTIVVAGFGRCGSSLLMQMLDAGGVTCTGEYPAFEDPAVRHGVSAAYIAEHAGQAVKVLDPHRVGLPGNVKVIWLDRDLQEQVKSHAKFASLMLGLHYSRAERRKLVAQLEKDRLAVVPVIGSRPVLHLSFEWVLANPAAAAASLANLVGGSFDQAAAARQVRQRSPRCAEGLDMELTLMGAAHG